MSTERPAVMITPETTVAELGSYLSAYLVTLQYDAFSRTWMASMVGNVYAYSGTGPDLITALNDALGKVGNGRS